MVRSIFGSALGFFAFALIAACSASGPEAPTSTSSAPLTICNCPLETPDSAPCTCEPPDSGPVCDPILCPRGEIWDRASCSCVPLCIVAADCHGALPDLCEVCPSGGDGCAHWKCVDFKCEIAFCPDR
jgi:hypothetical protein